MKLLFDENLSPKLVDRLATGFPQSAHVELIGMRGHSDRDIWEYAAGNDFIVVSKDNDFRQRSFVLGFPPKVVWLSVGNADTDSIATMLEANASRIAEFAADAEAGLLVLEPPNDTV